MRHVASPQAHIIVEVALILIHVGFFMYEGYDWTDTFKHFSLAAAVRTSCCFVIFIRSVALCLRCPALHLANSR